MTRRRLDVEMVRRGLVRSREEARDLVIGGGVLVAGVIADKAHRLVGAGEPILVSPQRRRWVSRGGDKLDAAVSTFGVAVAGRRCLDAGASTGGFTDCLLSHGAAEVTSVDVGRGQFDVRLRCDPRVAMIEGTNIKDAGLSDLGGLRFEVVVADLSFISLRSVIPALAGDLAEPGADLLLLVKPQFEAGRKEASRHKGVIRDRSVRRQSLVEVSSALARTGATIMGAMASPLLGPAGNAEYFLWAKAHAPSALEATDEMLDSAIAGSPDVVRRSGD